MIILQTPIIVAALLGTAYIATAIEPTQQSVKNSGAKGIRITSDKLVAQIDKAQIVYSGNVKVTQSGTVITAERLKIVYDPDTVRDKDGSLKAAAIRKIIARGRVKILYKNIVAEADEAIYTMKSAVLVITGNPSRVTRDGVLMTGSKITLQRSDGTLTVEGEGESRVRAIFNPDESQTK
jgi:lipopolysaccharide transport protein LptA